MKKGSKPNLGCATKKHRQWKGDNSGEKLKMNGKGWGCQNFWKDGEEKKKNQTY